MPSEDTENMDKVAAPQIEDKVDSTIKIVVQVDKDTVKEFMEKGCKTTQDALVAALDFASRKVAERETEELNPRQGYEFTMTLTLLPQPRPVTKGRLGILGIAPDQKTSE